MRFTRKKMMIGLVVGLVSVGMAAAAFAYWTGGGSGSGSASTATDTSAVTVNQAAGIAGIDDLYPGGTPVALNGTFTHANDGPVHIASLSATVADPAGTCAAADFAIVGSPLAINDDIATGDPWTGLSVRMVDDGTNQDDCKNVAITINYTANAS
jgi:hypothetical protein